MILIRFFFYTIIFFFLWGLLKVVLLLWHFRDVIKQIRKGQTSGQSGFGSWSWTNYSTHANNRSSQSSPTSETVSQGTAKPKKKLIPEDEGEYVDFEEID